MIEENGGKVLDNMQLKTILVKPNVDKEDVEVSKIIWENTKTGEIQSTAINSLYLSLGPSMKSLKVNIPAENMTLGTRLQNMFGINQNLIGQIMWASASSIVFMVRVDCSKIDDEGKIFHHCVQFCQLNCKQSYFFIHSMIFLTKKCKNGRF